ITRHDRFTGRHTARVPRPTLPPAGPRTRSCGRGRVRGTDFASTPDVAVVYARPGVARRCPRCHVPEGEADRLARARALGGRSPRGRRGGNAARGATAAVRGAGRGGAPFPGVRGKAGRRLAIYAERLDRRSAPRAGLLPRPVVTDLHDRAGPARTTS